MRPDGVIRGKRIILDVKEGEWNASANLFYLLKNLLLLILVIFKLKCNNLIFNKIMVWMFCMCVCMHSHFIENHPIRILEDGLLISEVVLSQWLAMGEKWDQTIGGIYRWMGDAILKFWEFFGAQTVKMTIFEFKWLVYMALIGHHGPVKSRYGDIDRYYQRGQQPGLYCDRAGSNGVGTDQPVWSVQLKADTPRLVQLRRGRGGGYRPHPGRYWPMGGRVV
jgi:hypothetical protein